MEITSFNPIVVSNDAESAIAVFEALGFERKHHAVMQETGTETVDLVDGNGFRIDVAQASIEIPRDNTLIRMNVRDFDTAYQILKDHGFKNTRGDATQDTASVKEATMVSPTGFMIALTYHKRKK